MKTCIVCFILSAAKAALCHFFTFSQSFSHILDGKLSFWSIWGCHHKLNYVWVACLYISCIVVLWHLAEFALLLCTVTWKH